MVSSDFTYFADWHGSHDLKFGVNFVHEPVLDGDFSIGTAAPTYILNGDSLDSSVSSISQNGGFSGYSSPKNIYNVFIQDDWRPSPRMTVNVGLRYDLNLGYDLNQSSNHICQELSTQTQYNDAPYYKDFQGWDCKLTNDHKNLAPRISATYDVSGHGKTLVHGGWGIYYDFPYLNATLLSWNAGEGVAEHANAEIDVIVVVLAGSASVTIDGELAHSGTVTFNPVGSGPVATGRIFDDGSYTIRTGLAPS